MRALLLVLALIGCSPAPMPVSHSSTDPSSPNAPEGHTPPTAAPAHPHAQPTASDAGGIVYVCPMHPEVTSTTPGETCPKCNMKLVPRK